MSENNQLVDAGRVFQELGEIKGSLKGVIDLINLSHSGTNKRIDDLAENVREQTRSLNIRIDDHSSRIDQQEERTKNLQNHLSDRIDTQAARIDEQQQQISSNKKSNLITSGSTSALVTTALQVLKELFT